MSYRSEILTFLRGIGARAIDFEQSGHGHPQLVFLWRGRQWRMGVAGTPSDRNAAMLKVYDIRRMLGLQPRARRVGERRARRRHGGEERIARCPALTSLPDWREPLWPLYRALCGGERWAA